MCARVGDYLLDPWRCRSWAKAKETGWWDTSEQRTGTPCLVSAHCYMIYVCVNNDSLTKYPWSVAVVSLCQVAFLSMKVYPHASLATVVDICASLAIVLVKFSGLFPQHFNSVAKQLATRPFALDNGVAVDEAMATFYQARDSRMGARAPGARRAPQNVE